MVFVAVVMLAVGCNQSRRENDGDTGYDNDDSKEQADEANAEKFEDSEVQDDADWIAGAVARNYMKIAFASLAAAHSEHADVQRIAKMLVDHHTKTLNELRVLAQNKAFSIPDGAGEEAQRKNERFGDEAGKDFDLRWCREMIDMHEESVRDFEKRGENTNDPQVDAFVNSTLPVLRAHLDDLRACEEKLEGR